jgi:putative FmdB family regulatory protein
MPIYEHHCLVCDLTFEVLAPMSRASRRSPCPRCDRPAPRVASAFAIASGAGARYSAAKPDNAGDKKAPEQPPLCLRYPHVPLLCHMDPKAARRWLAHYDGRGAEYDDKQAAREDLRVKRGLPPAPPPPPRSHSHDRGRNFRRHQAQETSNSAGDHNHEHHHDHAHTHGDKPAGHTHTRERPAAASAHAHGAHAHSH